jgi:MoaA/NifB/PqqE/SkfB family radical SAM enzyme
MFKFNELKSIHFEITNNCQASCPMCTRNIHGGIENPLLKINNWSLDLFKNAINEEVINQVDKLYFCGNFGDPLLNNDLPDMIKYASQIKDSIQVRIHTNGSLRSTSWWEMLADIMPKDHGVVFALDGLEDTHSLYRIGTNFNKIIENAKAYIDKGGRAEWAFIRFKHNEHQADEAKKLAEDLGFETFVMKDSSRFLLDKTFPVWNHRKEVTHYLEPSEYSEIKFIDRTVLKNYKELVKDMEIDCYVKKEKEIYLDAYGHLLPCCWLSSLPYTSIDHEGEVTAAKREMLCQYHELIDSLGSLNQIDIRNRSLKDIINSKEYQTVWDEYWGEKKLITCARMCGKNTIISTPNDQFITRDSLLQ